jgi:hypothetical protein
MEEMLTLTAPDLRFDDLPRWFRRAVRRHAAIQERAREPARELDPQRLNAFTIENIRSVATAVLRELHDNEHAEAYCDCARKLRACLFNALIMGTVPAWGLRGDAPETATAERVLVEEFARPVTLEPTALRCRIASSAAPDLWRWIELDGKEAMIVLHAALNEQEGQTCTPSELLTEAQADSTAGAVAFMEKIQHATILQHGRPLSRDALASACSKAGLATYREVKGEKGGKGLYHRLPPELRNWRRPGRGR